MARRLMAEASTVPRWGELAEKVASLFGLDTLRSPTLKATIERGVRYITVDRDAKELVFDIRALFLGLLAAGQEDRDSIRYGNTASWFAIWASEKVDGLDAATTSQLMSEPEEVFGALRDDYRVQLSASVRTLVEEAQKIAQRTIGRSAFEARHLLAAMINKGYVTGQLRKFFNVNLEANDINDLKQFLVSRIMATPESGETREHWHQALAIDGSPSETGTSPLRYRRALSEVPDFSPDVAARGADVLDTFADARALARLICLEGTAPLAVAIFGDWGSGKSTFMEQIDWEVRQVVAAETKRIDNEASNTGKSARFVRRVVQIRFNAWQFADANLWASLTAEFFDQLRAGGWDRVDDARHAGLVERVAGHVHSLSSEVEATRKAAIEGGKGVLKAQQHREAAARTARKAGSKALGQAAVDLLGDVYESQKANLSALGMAVTGDDTSEAIDTILTTVTASRSIIGQVTAVFCVLSKSPRRLGYAFLWIAGSALIGWLGYSFFDWGEIVGIIVTAIGAIGTIFRFLAPAISIVGSITNRSAEIARAVDAAEKTALKSLLQAEIQLREATVEAEALQLAADLAAQRLSRYVDPGAAANPPRLLRYVLEDDPNTKALEAEVGLIGRTRRLFQAVDDIAREERNKAPSERIDESVPDRIIIYIDDLDRCKEEQVYNALQAIHLLLAFRLFVVVVGVDVGWVQTALAKSIAMPANCSGSDAERTSRYLEKIFQVAFWLSPLSSNELDGGSFSRYVRDLTKPAPTIDNSQIGLNDKFAESAATDKVDSQPSKSPSIPATTPEKRPATTSASTDANSSEYLPDGALSTIQLESMEVDFLASPVIASVASRTPRAVKRLINTYRLVRSRLSESGYLILGDSSSPPTYPIAALAVAIEASQVSAIADAFYNGLLATDGDGDVIKLVDQKMVSPVTPGSLRAAVISCSSLKDACKEVARLRGGILRVRDLLPIVQIARRYSFNRYY